MGGAYSQSAEPLPWRCPGRGPCRVIGRQGGDRCGRGERSSRRRASCSALLGVIQPDVFFGHAALQESALGSPGLLTVLEQQSEVALGREKPGAQLPLRTSRAASREAQAQDITPAGVERSRSGTGIWVEPHHTTLPYASREQVRSRWLTLRGHGAGAATPGAGSVGIGSRSSPDSPPVRSRHSTPPPPRTRCRWEAAGPPQWMSLGGLVIGLLGPGLLQRHPGRVLPPEQPDETAVGGRHRRGR